MTTTATANDAASGAVAARTVAEPALIELPEQIETERLILRPPRVGEGAVVNAAIHESRAELQQWMDWAQSMPSVADTEANLRRAIARALTREDIRIQLHLKSDGTFVGASGFHRIDWSIPKIEIGYWVRTSMVGRGYMTEAVTAMTRFALDALHVARVEIRCDEKNLRSRGVAERARYQLEGILRNDSLGAQPGQVRNTAVYSTIPH